MALCAAHRLISRSDPLLQHCAFAFMSEVIDISDDDDPPIAKDADAARQIEDAMRYLGIRDWSVLERAVAEAVDKNANTAGNRQDIAILTKSQSCLSDMVDGIHASLTQVKDCCDRLGNPLTIECHCDGDGDVTTWDQENQCLVVPNAISVIRYDPCRGVVREAVLAGDEEEEDFIDSGGESEGSDVAVLEPVHTSAPKVELPAFGTLTEHKISKQDAIFFPEEANNVLSYWLRGKINQTYERDGVTHYAINFNAQNGSSGNCIRTEHFVVSSKPQKNRFQVRQRVVAYYRYRPDLKSRPLRLMAGFVAEPVSDRSEYLIFFDNGKAGYVPHNECFHFPKSTPDVVVQQIAVDSSFYATFLKKYFENYPERMMLKPGRYKPIVFLHENHMTIGKVSRLYHSLVQIVLNSQKSGNEKKNEESQWLYRGSWMLRDIFLTMFPNDKFSMKEPVKSVQRRKRATHKLSIIPPLRGYQKSGKDKKKGKKKEKPQSGRVPGARVIFSNVDRGSDSDFTDCSSQSTDQMEGEIRRKKFVKKRSEEYGDRMIMQRVEESRKKVFPIHAPCFPESVRKVLIDGKSSYEQHRCRTSCLTISHDKEAEAVDHMLGRENPFAIPLILGWRREIRSHEFISRTETEFDGDVYYRTPCGKSISSAEQVHDYLSRTRSAIPVDLFAFDPDLEIFCFQKDIGCFYYNPDLSDGVEESPIPVVNDLEDVGPDPFVYKKVFTLADDTRYDKIAIKSSYDPDNEAPFDRDFMSCCSCTDNCEDASRCECQSLTRDSGRVIYPVHDDNYSGYSYRRLGQVIHAGVYECHSRCPCDQSCLNRLVQLPIRNRLQIYKSGHDKGWGIRPLHDIPKGTFLCEYVARILTPEQGNDGNHDDTYFADLDHIKQLEANKRYHMEHPEDFIEEDDDSEEKIRLKREMMQGIRWQSIVEMFDEGGTYVVDAIREGNIGRFFNHSCDPNCEVQNVFLHTHDPRFPCICLFTLRTVKSMEELCWDYGYEVDSIPGRKMFCKCGSKKCRKRLL